MAINESQWVPPAATPTAPAAPLSTGQGIGVRSRFSKATTAAQISSALVQMVDFMMAGREPKLLRVNGKPPPSRRQW